MIFRESHIVLLAAALLMLALLSACSSSEEYPKSAVHAACGVSCTLDDIDCESKAMRECVL